VPSVVSFAAPMTMVSPLIATEALEQFSIEFTYDDLVSVWISAFFKIA
jgi:hypothetical protein